MVTRHNNIKRLSRMRLHHIVFYQFICRTFSPLYFFTCEIHQSKKNVLLSTQIHNSSQHLQLQRNGVLYTVDSTLGMLNEANLVFPSFNIACNGVSIHVHVHVIRSDIKANQKHCSIAAKRCSIHRSFNPWHAERSQCLIIYNVIISIYR